MRFPTSPALPQTTRIAALNEQVSQALGNGQSPNDLLDQRDQLITDLNRYVQTTQVAADDGSISVFVGSSQPLVLGNTALMQQLGIDVAPLETQAEELRGQGASVMYLGVDGHLAGLIAVADPINSPAASANGSASPERSSSIRR